MKRVSTPGKTVAKKTRTTTVATKKKTKKYLPTKVYIGKQPFPLQLFNTVKYAESVIITLSGIGFKAYQFSCNALYDPNVTGTGHQPAYFDQIMAIYDHYTALRSRFKITPCVNSSETTPYFACIYIDDDTSVVSTFDQALEQKNCGKSYNWLPSAGPAPTLYSSWDAAKTFGPNPQAQDSLQGSATTNPTEQSYFTFVIQSGATITATFTAVVEIEYDVVWDELKTISQS